MSEINQLYKKIIIRKNGSMQKRIIHAPSPDLKRAQQILLQNEYRNGIGPGPYAFGFVLNRGIRDHAAAHVGREYVIRIDIKDFFPTVEPNHLYYTWQRMEDFSQEEMDVRTKSSVDLSTLPDVVPPGGLIQLAFIRDEKDPGRKCLPQGSPLSPYLANIAFKPIDFKIKKMLKHWAPNDARYTRYADDLILSSDKKGIIPMAKPIRSILKDHGFRENHKKFRVMRKKSGRQAITGVVVNEKLNIPREKRDQYRGRVHRLFKLAVDGYNLKGEEKVIPSPEEIKTEFLHVEGYMSFVRYINPDLYNKYKSKIDATQAILKAKGII